MLIDTVQKFEEIKPDLLECLTPAVDTETNGLNAWGTLNSEPHHIIGISVGTDSNAYYFPYRHLVGTNLPYETIEFFRRYLNNSSRVYRGFNYKFDMHMLFADGIEYPHNIEDAMLAMHLLNENEPSFKLKELSNKYLSEESSKDEIELMDKLEILTEHKIPKSKLKGMMDHLTPSDVEPYACQDVILTRKLIDIAVPALQAWGLYDIWKQLNYYSSITAQMEQKGIKINPDIVSEYSNESIKHSEAAINKLTKLAGKEINPNSSPQICRLLGVESSASEILEVLAEKDDHNGEIAKAVIEARGWSSVNTRYYTPYMSVCDKDYTLHTSFNLIGTISGRLSSNNPNLQAVARQTDVFKVKDVFVAREGYTLLSADYSQAEMRLASYYAKETLMADNIKNGLDIHTVTAEMLGIPRDFAKRINFGVIYGIGKTALASQLRISETQAKDYLTRYHTLYPNFRKLYRSCEEYGTQNGFIRMWTGRVRRYNVSTSPTHKAMSNLIQGGVAEIMRIAISKLHPIITDIGGGMLLQIHDQIIFEIPDSEVMMAIPIIDKVMCDFDFDPRMKVSIKYGKSWGGMKE